MGSCGNNLRPATSWPRGYYRSGDALRLWVVVLAELPPTRETLLLRLLGNAAASVIFHSN